MRVTKKIKSDLDIINSLQRITGYKLTKKLKEKSPRMIFLQKISNNEYNNPIKVQILKSKNNNNQNINMTSFNTNLSQIYIPNNDINYYKNKIKEELGINNDINKLKKSFVLTNKNKNKFLESPKTNRRYKNTTINLSNQSPNKKDSNLDDNSISKTHHQMLNILSKNYAYHKKNQNSPVLSPQSVLQHSRKNTSDTNNSNANNKNMNHNN